MRLRADLKGSMICKTLVMHGGQGIVRILTGGVHSSIRRHVMSGSFLEMLEIVGDYYLDISLGIRKE